jgi:hypothetical protein
MVRKIVRAVGGTGFNLNMFPNVACSMAFFRVLRPVSVAETEIQHVAIGMKDGLLPPISAPAPARTFPGPDGLWHARRCRGLGTRSARRPAGDDLWIMLNRGVDAPKGVRRRGIMRAMPPPKWGCARPISSGRG